MSVELGLCVRVCLCVPPCRWRRPGGAAGGAPWGPATAPAAAGRLAAGLAVAAPAGGGAGEVRGQRGHCHSDSALLTPPPTPPSPHFPLQNCCFLALTLLDEFRQPRWCVATPARLRLAPPTRSHHWPDYDGEALTLELGEGEAGGGAELGLVRLKGDQQFLLVSLVLRVPLAALQTAPPLATWGRR